MAAIPRVIGSRVKTARERLGWNQAELARRLGASAYGVNLLEQGKTPYPRADRIIALAQLLGVSADYLLGLTDKTGAHASGRKARALGTVVEDESDVSKQTGFALNDA
jgi:transcriptional regulator with XRE-family HTH domain